MPKKAYDFRKANRNLDKTRKRRAGIVGTTFYHAGLRSLKQIREMDTRAFAHLFEALEKKPLGTRATFSATRKNGLKVDYVYERTERGCEMLKRVYHMKNGKTETKHLK